MKSLSHYSKKFNKWLGRRRWRIFFLGLPTLAAGLVLVIVAGLIVGARKSQLPERYERLVKIALGTKDFETARVASLRGLAEAKNERDRAQWTYYLAMAMGGLGQRQDSMALVSAAAPLDPLGAGCVEAHLRVATSLLSATNLTPEAVRAARANSTNDVAKILSDAERHLVSALAMEPNSVEANEDLGRFYFKTQQPEKARGRFMKIYAAKPETALLLALDADMEGNSADAVQWAERALAVYEHKLVQTAPRYNPDDRKGLVLALLVERKYIKTPEGAAPPGKKPALLANAVSEDSPAIWLGIVRMLEINGKIREALQTLEQRLQESTNADYKVAMGAVCAAMAQNIDLKAPGSLAARLHYIQEGITNAPWNVDLMFLLTEAADAGGETGASAKALLAEQISQAPKAYLGYWHFMAAREADARGDKTMALRELRDAHKLAPQDPLVANQAAYYQINSTNRADWEAGLKIINTVISACPDDYPNAAAFHGTRGLLLVRLGQKKEAAADLEFAVAKMPDAAEDREALARINGATIPKKQAPSADLIGETRQMVNNGDFSTAAKTLEQSLQVEANPSYATALADICAAWVEYLPLNQHQERLQIIQKGLSHDSQNSKLRALLIVATHADDASGKVAHGMLEQFVASSSGPAAAGWHFIWGQDARKKGDLATARRQLELAYGLAPHDQQINIELARVLATGDQTDLARGLGMMEPVVDQFPDSAEFRFIRGQILAGLQRNKEAVGDLSFALDRLIDPQDAAEARRILAKVYEKTGNTQGARHLREN